MLLDSQIFRLDFPEWLDVTQRKSIADLYPSKISRRGLYVLGFADGARYLGRTNDFVRRLGQHRKNHPDIERVTFKRVALRDQSDLERADIHALEAGGMRLRNIAEMSLIVGERDLDDLVSAEEQLRWLDDPNSVADDSDRPDDPGLRDRYARRYAAFTSLDQAADAIDVLARYLPVALPAPRRTEMSFWSLSCLPSNGRYDVVARMNLNMQEVLTLQIRGAVVLGSFHLASSAFVRTLGPKWRTSFQRRGLDSTDHAYKPGGHDQFNVHVSGVARIREFLDWDVAQEAMRTLNLNLMRKGPSYYGANHCFQLADAALSTTPKPVDLPRAARTLRRQRPLLMSRSPKQRNQGQTNVQPVGRRND